MTALTADRPPEIDSTPCMPVPVLQARTVDPARLQEAEQAGLGTVAARVLAARELPDNVSVADFVHPRLAHIEPPDSLADMDVSVSRLVAAILCDQIIGICSDYDVDGLTGHALVVEILTQHFGVPPDRVLSFVGHRLRDGYGVSAPLAETILQSNPRPDLLITIDNGSSDEARIARLSQHLDVIVTDHHQLPAEGPPASAFACINPQRDDCAFPDPSISGGFVAWMLMWATRRELMEIGHLPQNAASIANTLDLVACSVVADCVDLRSASNRAAVTAGIKNIASGSRPCWLALRPYLGEGPVQASSIAFGIGPRINARTRMESPFLALDFLQTHEVSQAEELAAVLDRNNKDRRGVERNMKERALAAAEKQYSEGACAITIYDEAGHPGVQGIVSSRIVEAFGTPALTLSPNPADPRLVTGSARSINGVDIRSAMVEAGDLVPGAVISVGGHRAAGGIKLVGTEEVITAYAAALNGAVSRQLGGRQPLPLVLHDGHLVGDEVSFSTVDALARLEPFGRGFPSPLFVGEFDVIEAKSMGEDRTHLRLTLSTERKRVKGVWFNARADASQPLPVVGGMTAVTLVYELKDNWFRGNRSLQLVIRNAPSTT